LAKFNGFPLRQTSVRSVNTALKNDIPPSPADEACTNIVTMRGFVDGNGAARRAAVCVAVEMTQIS
jgi:hypothetical protein